MDTLSLSLSVNRSKAERRGGTGYPGWAPGRHAYRVRAMAPDAVEPTADADARAWPDADERLRTLIERLPVVVYEDQLAPQARTLAINAQVEGLTGYPPEAFLRDPALWDSLVHEDDQVWVLAAWAKALERREPIETTYRIKTRDGQVRWVHDSAAALVGDDGAAVAWQGIMVDATPLVTARDEAAATESRYRSLVDQMPVVVYRDSDEEDPRTLYVSANVERVLGHTVDHYLAADANEGWLNLVHPDDRVRVHGAWRQQVATDGPFDLEYRFVKGDGTVVWVHDHCALVRDAGGRRLHWQGVIVDITARVEAESALQMARARQRALVENVPVVVYEMGPDDERRTLFVSNQIEQLLGYSRQEWLDQPDIWSELLHPDDRERELAAHDELTATGRAWSRGYRLIAADGRVVWVRDQATFVRDGGGGSWQGVLLDITAQREAEELLRLSNEGLELRVADRTTELKEANELMELEIGERRRTERELRAAQQRFQTLLEELPAIIYSWQIQHDDDDPAFTAYVSSRIEDVLGYTPDEWHSSWKVWEERVHPHDHDAVIAAARHSARTGEPFEMEYRYLAKDGRVVWVYDRSALLQRTPGGDPLLFHGTMIDITSKKEAEHKANEAEDRFREILEQGPVVSYSFRVDSDDGGDGELRVDYVSPQIATILGYPDTSWITVPENWNTQLHPHDRDRVQTVLARLASGEPWDHHYRMIAADGQLRWLHDRARCVERGDDGRPRRFLGTIADETDAMVARSAASNQHDQLRDLVANLPAITWTETVDLETGRARYTFISPQVADVLGYSPDELSAERDHFPRLVHPDDLERVTARSDAADRGPSGEWEDTYRVIHRDGRVVTLHARATRVTPLDQNPAVWHGISFDVTPEAEARERARAGTATGAPGSRRSRRAAGGSRRSR